MVTMKTLAKNAEVVIVRKSKRLFQKSPPLPRRDYLGTVFSDSGKVTIMDALETSHDLLLPTGIGPGAYEVHGIFEHVPGYGERMVKAEIEFISKEELDYLNREMGGPYS